MVYSDKQKIAYYKRKAASAYKPRVPKKRRAKKSIVYKYPGMGRTIGSGIGSMAGNLVAPGAGGMVGGAIGGAIGNAAHALVKNITGFGDYHVSKNSLVYNVDAVPEFSNANERCTVVCHREYITDVISSGEFRSQTFRINPAISTTFPWLSALAKNYEQYVVQGMVFEFKTTSATAIGSTNTSLGTVVMATQYNSLSPSFNNKQQMENYEFSQSSIPSQSILHAIECDPSQTQCGGILNMYDSNDSSGDRRLYDIGKFTIATVGMQANNSNIGELWVSYKICLLKPRLQAIENVSDFYLLDAASVTNLTPLGDPELITPSPYNSGITEISNINQLFIDPTFVGVLQVVATYQATTCASFRTPTIDYINGNCEIVSRQYSDFTTNDGYSNISDVTGGNRYAYTLGYVKVGGGLGPSGIQPIVAVSGLSGTATITHAALSIISVPDNMLVDPFP